VPEPVPGPSPGLARLTRVVGRFTKIWEPPMGEPDSCRVWPEYHPGRAGPESLQVACPTQS